MLFTPKYAATEDPFADPELAVHPILICLLGGFRVLKNGKPVTVRGNGKTETLLRSLALGATYSASREFLLDALWPRTEPILAIQSLNSLIYSLRKSLGDAIGGASLVTHEAGLYQLNVAAGIGVDIEYFEMFAALSERYTKAGNSTEAITACLRALYFYRGDLSGTTDTHSVIERERLRARYMNLLARLADHHYAQADYSACIDCAQNLLSFDPCYEEAHRIIMRCYLRQGARSQAMRQYNLCQNILRSELDTTPEPATAMLFEQIRLNTNSV